jgi:hypothetical protein
MKKYFKIILPPLALLLILAGCEKKVNEVVFEGGSAPVLTASVTGLIPLSFAKQDEKAVEFKWTNPNYTFNTGVSSRNVTYNLEIDTLANFTNPKKKVVTLSNDLSKSFTNGELNIALINDMMLDIGKTYTLNVRVVASLGEVAAVPVRSNVLRLSVTPYQDPTLLPPDLYITGDATNAGWTNSPPDAQKFTNIGGKKYEIIIAFQPGKAYKFLTKLGQWQPQYGSASSNGGALQVNDGTATDPPSINTPAAAGNYKISVDLGAMTYTIVKV